MVLLSAVAAKAATRHGVSCNWGLVAALAVPLVSFCLPMLRHTFGAVDRLQAKYASRRQAARAKLEGEKILPSLAKLMAAPFGNDSERLLDAIASGTDLDEVLEAELAKADYLPRLAELSGLYAERDSMDRLQDEASDHERRAVPVLLALLVVGLYFAVSKALRNSPLPSWSVVVSGVLAAALSVVTFFILYLSQATLNQLARLLRKYE